MSFRRRGIGDDHRHRLSGKSAAITGTAEALANSSPARILFIISTDVLPPLLFTIDETSISYI